MNRPAALTELFSQIQAATQYDWPARTYPCLRDSSGALVVKYRRTIRLRLSGGLCIFSGDFPVGGLYLDQIVADCVVDQFDDGVNL